jgi:hypothetical protein
MRKKKMKMRIQLGKPVRRLLKRHGSFLKKRSRQRGKGSEILFSKASLTSPAFSTISDFYRF